MNPEKSLPRLKLRSIHRIVNQDGDIVLGKGRMEILANIEKTGSINQAAKLMKMSYKGVWSKIKSTEKHLQLKVVDSDKKRGTRLTREGKTLLEKYKKMHAECCQADDRIFERLF